MSNNEYKWGESIEWKEFIAFSSSSLGTTLPPYCAGFVCDKTTKNSYGKCLDPKRVCDGFADCFDKTDESADLCNYTTTVATTTLTTEEVLEGLIEFLLIRDLFFRFLSSVFKYIIKLRSIFTRFAFDIFNISNRTFQFYQRSWNICNKSNNDSEPKYNSIDNCLSDGLSSDGSDFGHTTATANIQCAYWWR